METDYCALVRTVSFDPLYRYAQFYTFAASFFAIFPLLYLVFEVLPKTTFNENLKFLYTAYFLQVLVSVICDTIAFAHHVINPFFAETDCDLLVDSTKWMFLQYFGIFGISCPVLTNLGITCERLLALIWAQRYENIQLRIGFWIAFVAIFLDLGVITVLFRDERFDKPLMSYFMVPETSGGGMNLLCWTLLLLNFLNLLFNIILVQVNTVFRNIWRTDLSTRFQMEENLLTTKFSTCISFLHVFAFMLYLVSTLLIRLLGRHFLTTDAQILAVRGLYISIPTYHAIIGIVSCRYLQHLRAEPRHRVFAEISLKFAENSEMHEEAIQTAWKTKY